ncbi:DUF6470 family protein [Natroniella acetigena]|nr:DUF6470 family protein [Natroniella acetigena]
MDAKLADLNIDYGTRQPFQVLGDVKMDNPSVIVEIDQSKPLEELGRRSLNSLINFLENEAKQQASQAIAQKAREGDRLARIENPNNTIAEVAKDNSFDQKETTIAAVPESDPEINVEVERPNIELNRAKVDLQLDFEYPNIEAVGDKYEVYLAQEPQLDIRI